MIHGGTVVLFITEMERAVTFYRDTLGFKLVYRDGDKWASLDAGGGFMIGLHPVSKTHPDPGTIGSTQVSFEVNQPIDVVVEKLKGAGVLFRGGIKDEGVKLANFSDPDGNSLQIYSR